MANMTWSSSSVRNLGFHPSNASSNLVQAICPYCGDGFGPHDDVITTAKCPVSPGDFTVCLTCREILRFDDQLRLHKLNESDWLDLTYHKQLFIDLLRWRLQILMNEPLVESDEHMII